jgi:hypothetical protein
MSLNSILGGFGRALECRGATDQRLDSAAEIGEPVRNL